MKVAKSFFAAAGIMLAIAFNFSCSSLEDGDTFYGCAAKEPCNKAFYGVSSSSEKVSSSSSEEIVHTCEPGSIYDPAMHFCSIIPKCGGMEYDPVTQFCCDGVICPDEEQ